MYEEMLPYNREVVLTAKDRRDIPEMMARFSRAQAALVPLYKKEKEHLETCHGGARMLFNELPDIADVEALVLQAQVGSRQKVPSLKTLHTILLYTPYTL